MVQTLNFISLSSQQAPNDVDWAGLVKAGVQGALIRLGHGIIRDPCASGHIAKAKQYGLYWHGYHTYEGVVNEPQFTIKNATELGLSNSQYYFVDLTKSSDPVNDYYALHATWLSQGYSTGLLISSKDYLSKFTDSEVTASGTLRWLISDNVPSNYDVWQYSSEGTVGTSSVKVGFNFSKTDKLKYNLDTTLTGADFNKDPYNPETPVGGAYIGWGYDTTGLGGGKTIGYSTNGNNFYALIGPDGLIVRKSDGNRIYGAISDQIDSAISANVIPAKSAADSAVSAADAAAASAQVTSDAVTAIASATAEAKQGANEAMSRAESAWDVATGAKEAVTVFDPLLKSAQSDAKQANETATSAYEKSRSAYDAVKADSSAVVAIQSSMAGFQEDVASAQSVADSAKADAGKALTQIADTNNALSDAKTVFDSGVAEAKGLANTAQTTANSAVESAGKNAKELASQANALSNAKKAMDSDVASVKGLVNAAQSTADNAIKSASSVANDLAAVASQANTNASGITKVTSDVGLLQTTVADNSGNISKIQETAVQLQQAVSDNSGAIVAATQTAQSATTVASDAKSNATVAVQTASGASVTAKNAQGDAATAMVTAKDAVTQASDAKSNATIAVQTASEASVTATNAQGDASFAKQTASDASVQIKNAQGDISKLQTRAGTIEASVSSNSGAIADVQATANQLKASVSDNAGNITVAKQTADSAVAVASDARSNATVASQTASQASITASNASGQAASAVLTANGAMATASDAKSDATVAVQTASGASLTATNAQSDATLAKQTASEATVQASNAESDFAQLSIRANKIEANVATNSGAIASVQQTASGLTTTVGKVDDRVKTIEDKTNWTTKTGPLDMDTLTTTQNIYYRDTNLKNADGETGWAYIQVVSMGERVTQTVWHDRSSIQHTRTGAVSGSSYNWDAWNRTATYAQVAEVKQTVDGLSTLVNDPKAGMTATYQTASQASLTAQNASGQAVTAVTTAQGAVTTAKNAQSDAVVAKQTASEASVTASNAAGDASVAKQTASQASISVKNAQSNITSLDARADSLETFQKDASGNINKLVSRADGVDQTITNQKGDITSLQSRAGKLESSMSNANGQISTLQHTANGLTTTVADIKANGGGRNYLRDSDKSISGFGQDLGTMPNEVLNSLAGETITISVDVEWSNFQYDSTRSKQNRLGFELSVAGSDGKNYWWGAWKAPVTPSGKERVSATVTLPANVTFKVANNGANGYESINGTGKVSHAKIEGGTVSHDWSPAPEDLQNQFTQIKTTINGVTTTINDPKTGLNATYQTVQGNATTISNVKGDVAQLQATATGLTSRVGDLESKSATQQTEFDQTKAAILQLAKQTDVDALKGTVSQNTAALKTQANLISSKVTSSDVSGMLKGYATQDYTQSLVTQKADEWNVNLTKLKNDTQTSFANLAIGIEGIQAEIYNSDGSSKVTQLSHLIAAKVSQDDYNSQITLLKNDINQRVQVGDVISQINQEAGGDTLIQVSNGKKSLILDAGNTIFTGKAWIPSAAISNVQADQVMIGNSRLFSDDGTLNLVNQNGNLKALIQVKQGLVQNTTQSIISFSSDYNNRAFSVTPVGATITPTLFFERYDQTAGHWLGFTRNEVRRDGLMFHTWDDEGERFFVGCHARFDRNISVDGTINQGTWNGTSGKPEAGILTIKSGNTIWSGSDFLAIGDHISNSFTNVMARSFSQQSTLSSKTNIEAVDPKYALDLVNRTDILSYQYKTDVAQGKTKRYTSMILDDVNDVSKYYAPDEFANEERTGRDDGSAVGYLFLAVQELTRRIKNLEEKLNG